jgi:hypothetical protein
VVCVLLCESVGVVGSFSAIAPSVEDGENERMLWHENTSVSIEVLDFRINGLFGSECATRH